MNNLLFSQGKHPLYDETRKREINGLCGAMQAFSLTTGHIITMDEKETIKLENGNVINVVPAWEWMLGYNHFTTQSLQPHLL